MNTGKPARTIAFPNRNNTPAEAMIPSGNATVTVRYFSGGERFPAKVLLRLESLPPCLPGRPNLKISWQTRSSSSTLPHGQRWLPSFWS